MPAKDKRIALTITANTRQLRQDMRRAGREVKGFERQVTGLGNRLRMMRMRFQQSGVFGRGGGALRTAAGFAGAFGIQQMFAGAKEENAALTDIAITGNLTDKQLQKLRKTMFEVSNATAKSTGELTSFVATVTTMTGDAAGAQEALAGIGEVMVATGASGEALAGTYVKLTTTMGLLPKQAREAFNVLRSQEKLGSVTLANVSANIGKIIGAAGVYGAEGKGIKGVRTLGGLFQIAQRGFAVGQEGEAATSAAAFLSFMGRRAKQVKKTFGVDVFDKGGQARDLPTVLEELGKAFSADPSKLRTKGQLIFGRAGIRTAQQLAEAARGPLGFGGKVGTFASANALLRGAGGVDEISADAAKRRKSASYQFDEQINILKNSFQKHMIPVFKQLAATLKDVGPDLVRMLKFALENSRALFKLWLGYKGITFFKNLMAPVQGGAQGGAAGIAGMAAGGSGGAYMMPGGQMAPASALGARAGGTWLNPAFSRTHGFGVNRWSDAQMLRRERSRFRRAGRWMGRGVGRYGAAGLRGSGQILGAASYFVDSPRKNMFTGQDQAENMALMSGNPYAMAAGATSKGASNTAGYMQGFGSNAGWFASGALSLLGGSTRQVQAARGIEEKLGLGGGKGALSAAVDRLATTVNKIGSSLANGGQNLDKFYTQTWRGVAQKQESDRLIGKFDPYQADKSGIFSTLFAGGGGGEYGISPEQRVAMSGQGIGSLKTLHGKLGMQRNAARQAVIASLKKSDYKGPITEEVLAERSPQFAKLNDLYKAMDKLIADILSGKKITVNAIVPPGTTPAQRVEYNARPLTATATTQDMTE